MKAVFGYILFKLLKNYEFEDLQSERTKKYPGTYMQHVRNILPLLHAITPRMLGSPIHRLFHDRHHLKCSVKGFNIPRTTISVVILKPHGVGDLVTRSIKSR